MEGNEGRCEKQRAEVSAIGQRGRKRFYRGKAREKQGGIGVFGALVMMLSLYLWRFRFSTSPYHVSKFSFHLCTWNVTEKC